MKKMFLRPLISFGKTANATNCLSSCGNDTIIGSTTSTFQKIQLKLSVSFCLLKPGNGVLLKGSEAFYDKINRSDLLTTKICSAIAAASGQAISLNSRTEQ